MGSLVDHLRNGQQCDEEGIMCIVSRQACHEAADRIEALEAENARLLDALHKLLQCPAIADGELGSDTWGCPESREAELNAYAAIRALDPDKIVKKVKEEGNG